MNIAERRAEAISEVLHQAALVPGPVTLAALFASTMHVMRLPEQECAGEIYSAMALLSRYGLLKCNTHDREKNTVILGSETTFTPSTGLIDFMWSDETP